MDKLTPMYLLYIKTKKDHYFTKLYDDLKYKLKAKFNNNTIFKDLGSASEFDDIYQMTMLKLFQKTHLFNSKKGTVLSYAYSIFKNTIIDETRKRENKKKISFIIQPDIFSKQTLKFRIYNKQNDKKH